MNGSQRSPILKLPLFHGKKTASIPKSKLEQSSTRETMKLYASLYVGCQTRKGNMDEFFRHENHNFPPSLSDHGKIRKPTSKSDFINCLPELVDESYHSSVIRYSRPEVDAIIVDGPALVQMNPPKTSSTFGDYCINEIASRIKGMAETVRRVDVVFDVYREDSRKRETRDSRGKSGEGVRISVQNDTPIFRKFNQILSIDENKSELNSLIADTTIELCHGVDSVVVMTKGEDVLSNHGIERRNIEPCAKEEADDRMFLHAMAISRAGHTKLCIISPDNDVVIIALYAFWHLDVDELWVEYGVGKDRRWLPIHTHAHQLGESVCHALLFWHAFTGCDTVSQFAGRGKKTAWNAWVSLPEATKTFGSLPYCSKPSDAEL